MKLLVVGHGLIGAQRTRALSGEKDVSDIAVFDPNPRATATIPAKVRLINEVTLKQERFDAAIASLPHDTLVDLFPSLVQAAPYLLVEKPLGRNLAETKLLLNAAAHAQTKISVGYNYRFLKNVSRLRQLAHEGSIGRLLGVDAVLAHGAYPGYESSWKLDQERCGGGVCIDPGVHLIDLMCWIFGTPMVLGGALSKTFWASDVEDHASIVMSLPNGALSCISLSTSSWQSRLEIICEFEERQVRLTGRGKFYGNQLLLENARWPWYSPDAPRSVESDFGPDDTSIHEETIAFIRRVQGDDSTVLAEGHESIPVMQIVDECYRLLPRTWRPGGEPTS